MKEKILKEFDENSSLYASFGDKCKSILLELLSDNDVSTHHVSTRIKTRNSLSKKIDYKEGKYDKLEDITDLSGIRIITYLESDVNRVAEVIEKEFFIDKKNSIDKRQLRADQFGYRSLHFVVSFSEQRSIISENIKYAHLKLEIQVRSILQHAWAEIEHDLGYKGEIAIPEHFKRNFNRLAALLETADVEFDRLKKDLLEYENEVKTTIHTHPDEVLIDQTSLNSFIMTNEIFSEARKIIARNTGCKFQNKLDYKGELERFSLFNIETIGQLESLIVKNTRVYLSFVDLFARDIKTSLLNTSLPLFYFQHFLACLSGSEEFIDKYFNYGSVKMGGDRTAKEFIDIYQSALQLQSE